ncbi:uncharacterized protein LOC117219825 [Megalopta genalis]|uniref:uncharacterized protein LOC117219825 n=1 Tax=Megalopta genalis TaxID=115081 RepID=UPI0014437BC9|nr:uncharacterized protein LOC117219825 [Megalopta genalis]XP_033325184.1 uncharacterized protein LOC117219825 [Megalopta genalis]
MKMILGRCLLVAIVILLLDIIETGEAYKLMRSYKRYKRRPSHRPRWYTGHGSSKYYHSRRTPPEDYYSHRPDYYGSHTGNEDYDGRVENKPYTIVIQLPKGEDKYGNNDYLDSRRKYGGEPVQVFTSESDYIDEEDDIKRDYMDDAKVVNVNNKRVQIKMIKGEKPQLHIKISRSDDEQDTEFIDNANITAMGLLAASYANLTMSMPNPEENWTTLEPSTMYPEDSDSSQLT